MGESALDLIRMGGAARSWCCTTAGGADVGGFLSMESEVGHTETGRWLVLLGV